MRGTLAVTVLLLVAGCLDGKPGPGTSGGPGGTTASGPVVLNSTEDVLLQSPHLKILGPATVQWDLQNATVETPEMVSTLMYFGTDVPSDHHAVDPGIAFSAFVPLTAVDGLSGCIALGADVKHYLRNFGGGGDDDEDVGNLTGDYAKGWYHFVAIADGPASISISFDTEKQLRARKLPAPDPFVQNIQWSSQTGSREYHLDVETKGVRWFAWAQHQIGVNGGFGGGGGGGGSSLTQVDGGRTHSLAFNGDCAKAERVSTFPTVQTQNEAHRLRIHGGGVGGATVDAVYTPQQAASAPQTTLHVAAFAVKVVEMPSAPPPAAS